MHASELSPSSDVRRSPRTSNSRGGWRWPHSRKMRSEGEREQILGIHARTVPWERGRRCCHRGRSAAKQHRAGMSGFESSRCSDARKRQIYVPGTRAEAGAAIRRACRSVTWPAACSHRSMSAIEFSGVGSARRGRAPSPIHRPDLREWQPTRHRSGRAGGTGPSAERRLPPT